MNTKKIITPLLFSVLIFSEKNFAIEDNISPLDQSILNQKQKDILQEAQRQENLGSKLNIHKNKFSPSEDSSNTICYDVKNIEFNNSFYLSKSEKGSLIKSYISKCLTIKDINSLTKKISNYYIEQGYVTSRAIIKPQDLSQDTLVIDIIKGKINSIEIEGEGSPIVLKLAFPNMIGKPLNLRDIEQGLDQLNRLSSQKIEIDIQPSEKSEYSDVVLKKVSKKWLNIGSELELELDNSGQKSTGETQLGTTLKLDNLLHLADLWTVSFNKDTDFSNSHKSSYLLSEVTIPYGYWLLGYQYSWNKSVQNININLGNIDFVLPYEGKGQSHTLKINRTLYRDGKQKLAFNTNITRRETENSIGGYKLATQSSILSTINLGFNYSSFLLGGYFSFNPSVTKGLHIFDAKKDNPSFKNEPRSQFHKFSASSSYFKFLTNNIYYLTSAYGQYSPYHLYSSERVSLGGQYSIRGFKESNIVGNIGGYWRNELNWQVATLPLLGDFSLKGSLDTGWIKNETHRISEGGNLTGVSFGMFLSNNFTNHSITVGKPLKYPNHLKPDNCVVYWSSSFEL
ncbi:ShlB/FhaC/HecB family hemolysin secretion/activation protein [Xenorhabdus sp. XENO-1]|uniref:ShlB/FhaC/HecB family hemolysin secretion/activation protein n=1 Tax=Xenorhabdus bovienii TaxID=40576 RepID=UPI0020CA9562|nr:ShlB/FhaC/HecB family hemolysin secretion/activation protein [Xenorhabdus bovienii]MCP9267497.1 ShlB/FhaC/HecB family hemolysin secretion/activation protein [Xenorhabdus bovienii subsp. africana]